MEETIYGITSRCARRIWDAQSLRGSRSELDAPDSRQIQFQDLLSRLELWSHQYGAMARGNGSMDHRLRNDRDIQEVFVSMLTTFHSHVADAVDLRSIEEENENEAESLHPALQFDTRTPTGNESDSASSVSLSSQHSGALSDTNPTSLDELEMFIREEDPIKKANQTLDQIYRLSSLLRKPVSASEDAKIRQYIMRLESLRKAMTESDSKGDIDDLHGIKKSEMADMKEMEDLEDCVQTHLRFLALPKRGAATGDGFASASTDAGVQIPEHITNRIVSAAKFRRMKHRYRERHQEKLSQSCDVAPGQSENEVNQPVTQTSRTRPVTGTSKTGSHAGERRNPLNPNYATPRPPLSGTIASSLNASAVRSGKKSFDVVTSRTAITRRHHIEVPPLPAYMPRCIICFRLVDREDVEETPDEETSSQDDRPLQEAKETNWKWTRHVLRDLEPYVCLFKDCIEGDRLYQSSEDWIYHLQWSHTLIWQCPVPHQPELVFYDTADELEQHLQECHSQAFSAEELPGLVQRSSIPAKDTFAGLATESTFTSGCTLCASYNPEFDIRGHLLEHLEKIAVMSLPPNESEKFRQSRNSFGGAVKE
ncbi:hypothetical protein QBC35DRAFT_504549 [Podospora australis]|uniref:C2H2-type domain-containing protein n=1 Tax=Podospora australis TaxID=1536484 RepID=A0AAN6WNH2_9PEZI|nr:hypothetical protein QBC35DRAFT_504549 [Podospora australis]